MNRGKTLLLTIIFIFSVFSLAEADPIKDAQSQLDQSKSTIDSNKNKINEINQKQADTQKQLDQFDSQIEDVSGQLSTVQHNIEELNNNIALSEKNIEALNAKIASEEEAFNARVKVMYMRGNIGYLEAILSAKDFSSLLSRISNMKRIMEFDRALIKNTNKDKSDAITKKSELEKNKSSVTQLQTEASSQLNVLQDKVSQKDALMKSLDKDKAYYMQRQKEEEAQSQKIKDTLAQLQAEAKKKAEAAAEAAKAADSAKNNPGTSSGTTDASIAHKGNLYCVTGRSYSITSPYGWRTHPIFNTKIFHSGIDIGVPSGTKIYSLTDGLVIYSGWMSGYGNVVMVDHGSYTSLYAHNSSLAVTVGQTVKGGQLISYSGSTGNSTGPHLHFEIRLPNGDTTDSSAYYIH
jgi:murein DD-endopeptidase MepM/ murein hydrolase activator NlpD